MERLCIIDHSNHILYIEDVDENLIKEYGGDEDTYIQENYPFIDNYSWDYIVDAQYIPDDSDPDPIEIDFNLIKG